MAGFQTHITVSTALGVGYAWWGHEYQHESWSACAVAGVLCSIAGMMPDLDSDSGVPARETISFAAAVAPMLAFNRLNQFGLSVEHLILVGAPLYLFIRFGIGTLLKLVTVHRGMFHSIPALAIAGMLTYLVCDSGLTAARVFKAGGVMLGFLSHLVLDEIWSVQVQGVHVHVKHSFGTALKFFSANGTSNSLCYGLLILVGLAVMQDRSVALAHVANQGTAAPSTQARTAPEPTGDEFSEPPPDVPKRSAPRRIIYQAKTHRFDADPE